MADKKDEMSYSWWSWKAFGLGAFVGASIVGVTWALTRSSRRNNNSTTADDTTVASQAQNQQAACIQAALDQWKADLDGGLDTAQAATRLRCAIVACKGGICDPTSGGGAPLCVAQAAQQYQADIDGGMTQQAAHAKFMQAVQNCN